MEKYRFGILYINEEDKFEMQDINTAFDYITAAERIEIDYEMKITRNFDLKTVENMSEKMSAYFNNAEKRIAVILDLLEKAGENL